jgi:hypothetical protein
MSVEYHGSSIVAKLDGITVLSITDSTHITGTKVGIYDATSANLATWDDFEFSIPTPTDPITITDPMQYQPVQSTGGVADVTVVMDFASSPTTIEVSRDNSTWVTSGATPAGVEHTETLEDVPVGEYTVFARHSNNHANSDSVANVRVGHVFVITGQSNAAEPGQYTNNGTYTGTAGCSEFSGTSWANIAAQKTVWPEVFSAISNYHSAPVGIINTAVGGSRLVGQAWAGAGRRAASTWPAAERGAGRDGRDHREPDS